MGARLLRPKPYPNLESSTLFHPEKRPGAHMRRWFANTGHPKSDIADWQRWSIGSIVETGAPRPTEWYSIEQLQEMKIVGLYEVRPGIPPLPEARPPSA